MTKLGTLEIRFYYMSVCGTLLQSLLLSDVYTDIRAFQYYDIKITLKRRKCVQIHVFMNVNIMLKHNQTKV